MGSKKKKNSTNGISHVAGTENDDDDGAKLELQKLLDNDSSNSRKKKKKKSGAKASTSSSGAQSTLLSSWPAPDESTSILSFLASINQAQAMDENLKNFRDAGGIQALLKTLQASAEDGIPEESVEARRAALGHNSLPSAPRATFFELFRQTFEDATLQILIFAAIVSLGIGLYDDPTTGYVEGIAILAAVLIVSTVTAANDYQKETQFRDLTAADDKNSQVVVTRSGVASRINVAELVVGDLFYVEAGGQIPCDGVLVRKNEHLEVDESALTGEPMEVDKDPIYDPFLLSGSTCTAGSGQILAIGVGKDSQWGIIKSRLEKEQEHTPLQEKLDDMAAMIGYIGMAAAAATFVAMILIKLVVKPDYLANVSLFNHALDAFIIAVTIVVVAVPEGLPLAVTISLAYSTKKMLADNNLIRHLAACETMGNATNICSDKTGTLTQNRMTVVRGVFANLVETTSNPNAVSVSCPVNERRESLTTPELPKHPPAVSDAALEILLEGIACCSTARLVTKTEVFVDEDGDEVETPSLPDVIGNKTEAALLILAQSPWGKSDDTDARRAKAKFGEPGGSRLFPFSSARKRMSVLVKHDSDNNGALPSWTLYHKGAAELVLSNCITFLDRDGSEQVLTPAKRQEFEGFIQEYATAALRCVALCHRRDVQLIKDVDLNTISMDQCAKVLENNMCLDALVGIADPLREDVIDAVATCQRAGIVVRMVTGDNLETAVAIAKQAGILTEDGLSMTGPEFRKLTPAQLDVILPRLQVLARSSPEDKHILVQRLNGALMPENEEEWLARHPGRNYMKERDLLLPGYKEEWAESRGGVGEVVGVTGDGTNDGPALKAADVGLAMGQSGTDVAKRASDIIILDDNFSSIVKAVLWGRSVYDNIRKFLQFQLTVNVVALTITFLSAVAGYKPPLNAVMMLWVNLIMDTMGALALGTEPPHLELLDRRPYRRDASLISRPMWRNIFVQATYQLALLVFLLNKGPRLFDCEDGSTHHFTILFNAFVFCQVFNEFNAREIGDVFDPAGSLSQSPMFLVVIAFTVIMQYSIVEYGGDFTQTYPLTWDEWKITVGLGAISIPVGLLMRFVPVQEDPASFAGNAKTASQSSSWLWFLIAVLLAIISALVYQLYWEVEELKH